MLRRVCFVNGFVDLPNLTDVQVFSSFLVTEPELFVIRPRF